MANKANIKEAFYGELVSAATGSYTVDYGDGSTDTISLTADDISLRDPEDTESLPRVVYHDTYRVIDYNGVGKGPDRVRYANDGTVEAEIWRVMIEAQFIVDARASDENSLEPVYDAVRRAFEKYSLGGWSERDLNEDIWRVNVDGPTPADSADAEAVIRGDQLDIRLAFHKDYERTAPTIESIEAEFDIDDDGTTDITHTTS